ncbi:MAG: hypothetical protein EXR35_01060 [Limnohabitans sp.]|nr:hypothetical protein [Limnohabitans sp.]
MNETKALSTQARYYSIHHLLFRTAEIALKEAIDSPEVHRINALKAIIFSALGTEAFINALGNRTRADWNKFERNSSTI